MALSLKELDLKGLHKKFPEAKLLLNRPVYDLNFQRLLQHRARVFRTEGVSIPMEIEQELTFDLGMTHPMESCVVSPVVQGNSQLLQYLSQKLCLSELGPTQVSALFTVYKQYDAYLSLRHRAPVFHYFEFVSVILNRKGKDLGIFVISSRGMEERLYTTQPHSLSRKNRHISLSRIVSPPNSRYYGLYSWVPMLYKTEWRAARYGTRILLPQLSNSLTHPFSLDAGIQVGKLEAISATPFQSAHFLGLELNRTVRPPRRRDVNSAQESYCVNQCNNIATAGETFAAGIIAVCIKGAPLGLGWLVGCGMAAGAIAVLYYTVGLVCAQNCGMQNSTPNLPSGPLVGANTPGDDGPGDDGPGDDGPGDDGPGDDGPGDDGPGDDGSGGAAGAYATGGALPTEETTDPFFDA